MDRGFLGAWLLGSDAYDGTCGVIPAQLTLTARTGRRCDLSGGASAGALRAVARYGRSTETHRGGVATGVWAARAAREMTKGEVRPNFHRRVCNWGAVMAMKS